MSVTVSRHRTEDSVLEDGEIMFRKHTAAVVAAVSALSFASISSAAVTIDGFDVDQFVAPEFVTPVTGPLTVVSSIRTVDASISTTPGSRGQSLLVDIYTPVNESLLIYSLTDFAAGDLTLTYNNLALDLSGDDNVVIDFAYFDFALGNDLVIEMTVVAAGVTGSVVTNSLAAPVSGSTNVFFPLAATGFTPAMLSSVTSITFEFGTTGSTNVGRSTEFHIDRIFTTTIIPEPSVLALAIPATGMLLRRRRA